MEATEHTAVVDGIAVRYQIAGEGPPLILVHGLWASKAVWRANFDSLAGRHTVCAVDLPGYGDSDKPRDIEYSAPAGGHFLPKFLDALNMERAVLIGNSAGGLVAAHCALFYPHRVEKLVLVSPAGLGWEIAWPLRLASIPLVGELICSLQLIGPRWVLTRLFQQPRPTNGTLAHQLMELRSVSDSRLASLRSLRSGVNILGLRKEMNVLERLKSLEIPLLVVWGDEDRIMPVSHAYHAANALPNSKVHVMAQCGHWPYLERPEEFNQVVLQFLANE